MRNPSHNKKNRPALAGAGFTTLLTSLALVFGAQAQEQGAPKIVRDIDVEYVGERSVSPDRILSNMSVKIGDVFSQAAIEDDIKNLYASGDVENIRVLSEPVGADGIRLIVVVEARSLVGKVSFQGHTAFSERKLSSKVSLKVGEVVDEAEVQAGQREIQALYDNGGYTDASVAYEIRPTGTEGFSEVVYKIREGDKSLLRNVDFVGNSAFTSKELRKQMDSKDASLLSAFTGAGKISSDQLASDLDKIERYYRNNGYLNAEIVDTRRIRVDDKKVDLVVTIDEGQVYSVNDVEVRGARAFNVGDLRNFVKTAPGSVFSAEVVEQDIAALREYYGSRGYAEVRVTPRLESAGGTKVDVIFDIREGDKYYIGMINVEGNNKTKDEVIRRELAVEPGGVFSTPRIEASQRRLQNTGYFGSVDILPIDTGDPEFKDLTVTVAEKPTGALNFGAGFSSIDNFVGFIEVTQTNFDLGNWPSLTGGGQRFRAAARVGTERRDFILSLTEPWFLGRPLSFGGELFYRDLLFLSDDYEQTNFGFSLNARRPIGEHTHIQANYKLQNVEIGGISSDASDIIRAEEGDYLQSLIGADVIRDTRDDLFVPRTGHRLNAGIAYSGLGGDVEDFHLEAGAIQYFHLPFDTIFSIEGHVHAVSGDDVPIFERQFLGGANNLRGFDFRDVGPKDATGEPIGGLTSAYATAEYTFPVMPNLRGALFYDIGVVSSEEYSFSGDVNSNFGFGIRLFLPVGPLRLDYGIPISSDEFNDSTGRFHFNIGYRF